jgi:hypothetical protein
MMKNNRPRSRALAIALCLGMLGGCTTYVGHKLPASGQLPEGKPSGVPFVMTKPEFSVDIAADVNDPTKPVYTLKSADVPDPTQRYSIALDPALLVDGTFDLTFGEQGNIAGATAATTSRVVATLESLVSFAINQAASGVAKDMGTVLAQYQFLLRASQEPACTRTRNGVPIKTEIDLAIKALVAEARLEVKESDAAAATAKASSLAASRFHYRDAEQKLCLVAFAPTAAKGMDKSVNLAKTAYEADLSKSRAAATGLSGKWVESLEVAVKALDVGAIDELGKAKLPAEVKAASGSAKKLVNARLDEKKLALMADLFAYMSPETWRARHLHYLEVQLKQLRLDRLLTANGTTNAKKLDGDIERLELQWAATLGEPKLMARIQELDTFLARVRIVPASGANPARYAAADHVQLREERDKLQDRADKLRNELLAKNKVVDASPEKKKVEPRSDIRVKLVKPSFIKAVADNPGVTSDLPEYVLVVTPISEPTITPDPATPTPAAAPAKKEATQ